MYPLLSRLVSIVRLLSGVPRGPPRDIATASQGPALPNWTTRPVRAASFQKVGRVFMGDDGLEIHSDLDGRGFILQNEDIDAVLDGDTRGIRLLGSRELAGSARLSGSGKAMNIAISPFYYTVPLRSVLAVLDGRNRKGAVFSGK